MTRCAAAATTTAVAVAAAVMPTRALATFAPEAFYFRQLQAGRDFALEGDAADDTVKQLARSMANFVYVVGDRETGVAWIIDGCWDVPGLAAVVEGMDNMTLSAFVATHYHFDHIGGVVDLAKFGAMGRLTVPGLREFAEWGGGMPTWVPTWETALAAEQTRVPESQLDAIEDGQVLHLSDALSLEFLHTPGHSPGSMCIRVRYDGDDMLLVSGDTVFPGSCGRLDLPGSDSRVMYDSLRRLAELPDELPVFPGHAYNGASSTIGREKQQGLLRPMSREQWERQMVR